MRIEKIEAIRMPKEASGLPSETFLLLFQYAVWEHVLPNGKRQLLYNWTIPFELFKNAFNILPVITNDMMANSRLIDQYEDSEGNPYGQEKFEKDVLRALGDSVTVEEEFFDFIIEEHLLNTSKSLFDMLCDFKGEQNVYVDRSLYNIHYGSVEDAGKSFFSIKCDNYYIDTENGEILLCEKPDSAIQVATSDEAVDIALSISGFLSNEGFEIIEVKGMAPYDAKKYLEKFNPPYIQSMAF